MKAYKTHLRKKHGEQWAKEARQEAQEEAVATMNKEAIRAQLKAELATDEYFLMESQLALLQAKSKK